MNENTKAYSLTKINEEEIRSLLNDVYSSLTERGYNAENQIVGYLMSGDPGYISSHNNARNKISQYERNHIISVILKEFLR